MNVLGEQNIGAHNRPQRTGTEEQTCTIPRGTKMQRKDIFGTPKLNCSELGRTQGKKQTCMNNGVESVTVAEKVFKKLKARH